MNEPINVVRLRQQGDIDDPLTDVLRSGARRLLAQAVELEAEVFLAGMQTLKLPDGRARLVRHGHGVNGGLNPGQRSGVKPGQWIGHADMERAPIGALSMSARIFDQAAVISPVSGSMLSAVAWFCSALTDARRRPTDCLRR